MNLLDNAGIESLTHELVAEFIKSEHPDEAGYLPFVWQWFTSHHAGIFTPAGENRERIDLDRIGLHYEGDEAIELVSPWAILVVTGVLRELNYQQGWLPKEEEVRAAIQASAKIFGASENRSHQLADRLAWPMLSRFQQAMATQPAKLPDKEEYLVWELVPPSVEPTEGRRSKSQIETKYLSRKEDFDIFIRERTVYQRIKGKSKFLPMEDRHFRLLVMFLRYKGRTLPSMKLFLNAWQFTAPPPGETESGVVKNYLKTAVSELRDRMRPVKRFEIPGKLRQVGYSCQGDFSFCLILNRAIEQQFALPIT